MNSPNENKIKKMARNGHKGAEKILNTTKNSSNFLATIQVGVTLSGFLTSASASTIFASKVAEFFSFLPLSMAKKNLLYISYRRLKKSFHKNAIFFHPDYTVGTGITPVHALRSRTITADQEFHLPQRYKNYYRSLI